LLLDLSAGCIGQLQITRTKFMHFQYSMSFSQKINSRWHPEINRALFIEGMLASRGVFMTAPLKSKDNAESARICCLRHSGRFALLFGQMEPPRS